MKEKRNVIFTFDYELFLGEISGTAQTCLIEPTEMILKILNLYKIKGIFFIDTAYLMSLKMASLKDHLAKKDLEIIFTQVRKLIEQGHYIFPHIHPHWLDAIYIPEVRQWKLANLSKYRFHNLDDSQKHYLFEESIKILQEITFTINPYYAISGYRAGGWSIEPFSDFKPFFEKFNIKYDFSVLPGIAEFSTARYFDYPGVPGERNIYCFKDDITQENTDGSFMEFCVSVLPVSKTIDILDRVWRKIIFEIYDNMEYRRGKGILSEPLDISNKNNFKNKGCEMASIELMTIVKLPFYIKFLKNNGYMHIASHPKLIGKHNLYIFGKFLDSIYKKYQIETDFYKMI